jgi:chromosome partitioning protein
MVVTIGGIKGGVGKSTIATNFAVRLAEEGRDVLLIDADQQVTSSGFTHLRWDNDLRTCKYEMVQLTGRSVYKEGLSLAQRYQDVIVDVGGRDTAGQRAAMTYSDLYLVPFAPSAADVWTIDTLDQLLAEMKPVNPDLIALSFINKASPQGSNNAEARELLAESQEIQLIDCSIGNRKIFQKAIGEGLGINEFRPRDHKASEEFEALFQHCLSLVNEASTTHEETQSPAS